MRKQGSKSTLGTDANPTPGKRRTVRIILCLSLITVAWAGLVYLAHQPMNWAVSLTHELFGWMILATYFSLWGALIFGAQKPKLPLFHGIMFTLTLVVVLGMLEAAAAFKIVHWQLVLERIAGDGTNYM